MKKRIVVNRETKAQKEKIKEISFIFNEYITKMKENGSYYQYVENSYNLNKDFAVTYESVIRETDKNFEYIKSSLSNNSEESLQLYLKLIRFAENNVEQWFEMVSDLMSNVESADILRPEGLFFINNFWANGVQDDWELYIVDNNGNKKIVSDILSYEKFEYLNTNSLEVLLDELSHKNKRTMRP